MTSVITTDKSLFRNTPSKVNLMKEEGSLRRGFVHGKFRIIISVSSAIFMFRWDDFIEYAQKINVEEFKWVFHAQVVFKGHQLCMVKAMVIFFWKDNWAGCYKGNATENFTLQMKTLTHLLCKQIKHLRAIILTQLLGEV